MLITPVEALQVALLVVEAIDAETLGSKKIVVELTELEISSATTIK